MNMASMAACVRFRPWFSDEAAVAHGRHSQLGLYLGSTTSYTFASASPGTSAASSEAIALQLASC
jgi:hypothetical protein